MFGLAYINGERELGMNAEKVILRLAFLGLVGLSCTAICGDERSTAGRDNGEDHCTAVGDAVGNECRRSGGPADYCTTQQEEAVTNCSRAGEVSVCVASCIEEAAANYDNCRDFGGSVAECTAEMSSDFMLCAGAGGCQGPCASACSIEVYSVFADCIDGGGGEDECSELAQQSAQDWHPSTSMPTMPWAISSA